MSIVLLQYGDLHAQRAHTVCFQTILHRDQDFIIGISPLTAPPTGACSSPHVGRAAGAETDLLVY